MLIVFWDMKRHIIIEFLEKRCHYKHCFVSCLSLYKVRQNDLPDLELPSRCKDLAGGRYIFEQQQQQLYQLSCHHIVEWRPSSVCGRNIWKILLKLSTHSLTRSKHLWLLLGIPEGWSIKMSAVDNWQTERFPSPWNHSNTVCTAGLHCEASRVYTPWWQAFGRYNLQNKVMAISLWQKELRIFVWRVN